MWQVPNNAQAYGGPPFRSICNKRKALVNSHFILGSLKPVCLGSSVSYCQAQQQNFWAASRGLGTNAQGFALAKCGRNDRI